MLSTERAFSIKYPVKNSSATRLPHQWYTPRLNKKASAIQKTLQPSASRTETTWLLR